MLKCRASAACGGTGCLVFAIRRLMVWGTRDQKKDEIEQSRDGRKCM